MALIGNPRNAGKHLREHYPVGLSKLQGGEGHTNIIGNGILVRNFKTGTTTTLYDEVLRTYGNDFFNGMQITALKCSSIATGESSTISDFVATTDSGLITVGTAFSAAPAAGDLFYISIPSYTLADGFKRITTDITMAVGTTTGTVAEHEVLTVTGLCRVKTTILCTTNVAGTGSIQFGVGGATSAMIGATTGTELDATDVWYDTTPTTAYASASDAILDVIVDGLDIGYEITVGTLTSGVLRFIHEWQPLEDGAICVAATGTAGAI